MTRLIPRLIRGPQAAGHHVVAWNGRDNGGLSAASGIYLVRLESQGQTATRKIALVR